MERCRQSSNVSGTSAVNREKGVGVSLAAGIELAAALAVRGNC